MLFPRVGFDLRTVRVAQASAEVLSRFCGQRFVMRSQAFEIFLFQLLQIEQGIVGTVRGSNQLVELELDRYRVTVLRVLDQEHHQESDDGSPCVDNQLPGIAEAKQRPSYHPCQHNQTGNANNCWMTRC